MQNQGQRSTIQIRLRGKSSKRRKTQRKSQVTGGFPTGDSKWGCKQVNLDNNNNNYTISTLFCQLSPIY